MAPKAGRDIMNVYAPLVPKEVFANAWIGMCYRWSWPLKVNPTQNVHSSKGMHNKLAGKDCKIDDLLHVRLYKCMIAADDQDLLGKLYWGMPKGTYTVQWENRT